MHQPASITALALHLRDTAPGTVLGDRYQAAQNDANTCIRLEKALARQIGPVEAARRSLIASIADFHRDEALFAAASELAAESPADPRWRETLAQRRADLAASLDWLADRATKLRQEVLDGAPDDFTPGKRAA